MSSPSTSASLTETSLATDAAEGTFPDAQQPWAAAVMGAQPCLTANCHMESCAL